MMDVVPESRTAMGEGEPGTRRREHANTANTELPLKKIAWRGASSNREQAESLGGHE